MKCNAFSLLPTPAAKSKMGHDDNELFQEDQTMPDNTTILRIARAAARVAAGVLDFGAYESAPEDAIPSREGFRYSVVLVDRPDAAEDGYFNTKENEIQINAATIKPFPGDGSEEIRLVMSICYVVYHEMRHFYQKRAVEAYVINQMFGSGSVPMLENKKRCEKWLAEMGEGGVPDDVEEDADAFADYLISRWPYPGVIIEKKVNTSKVAGMKRRYDKVALGTVFAEARQQTDNG